MKIYQKEILLPSFPRGFHLITAIIIRHVSEISKVNVGYVQVFIKHTSASLTINEAADPTVRTDFESHFNTLIPENTPYFEHVFEGKDDMPAHLKASLLGASVQIPISQGRLNLGTWQGIYLGEHRNHGGQRRLVVTVVGE